MATVDLEHVHKTYEGGFEAVRDFNLAIKEREFIVLVGPSGCGKSTTLRMVAGLEEITSGTISIGGKVMNKVAAQGSRHRDGVPELRALPAHDGVREHGVRAEAAEDAEGRRSPRRCERAADVLGIVSELEQAPKQLRAGSASASRSGGRSCANRKCFLFDEPLSNLDAKLRVEMRAEIKRLHLALGSTTVYVTHDQEEAMTLGDRVVVMKDGVIQQCASAARHLPPARPTGSSRASSARRR